MFDRLKKKYWGEKIYSVSVDSAKASCVYVWRRGGELSLNIKSENFSYVQAGSRNDATVTFEPGAIESLLGAIMSARTVIQQTSARVS